jgi:sarcosine oxidase subunit delta
MRCPNCGLRDVSEFRFAGESKERPASDAEPTEWADYIHLRNNVRGEQAEWWRHRLGCGKWFMAIRDTNDNSVIDARWPRLEN